MPDPMIAAILGAVGFTAIGMPRDVGLQLFKVWSVGSTPVASFLPSPAWP